jgi:glutaredoxin 1
MEYFIIYGKANCTFCRVAKQLLDDKKLPYDMLLLHTDYTVKQLVERIQENSPDAEVTSVPQIFHGTEYIGGAKELAKYVKNL